MSKRKALPSQEYLKECFEYDPDTGILTWKERPRGHFNSEKSYNIWSAKYPHKEAGCTRWVKNGYKYMRICINYEHYKYHRIVWKLLYNEEPYTLDHLDGNATNNRLSNLCVSDNRSNAVNTCMHKTNKTGITGVCWSENKKAWIAQIYDKGKHVYLKTTKDFFEACCVRRSAENRLGYSSRHGRKPAWYLEKTERK